MTAQNFSGLLISLLAAACIVVVMGALKKMIYRLPDAENVKSRMFRKALTVVLLWVVLITVLAMAGVLAAPGLPPRPMMVVVFALLALLALSYAPRFKNILRLAPLHWLLGFQAFRIGVELWFWYSYQSGVFPKIMTFEGANLDIIAGLLALPAAWAVRRGIKPRFVGVAFNIAGMLILLNTLRAAALSMPSPFQQYPFDERLLLLGTFPFIYLPGILVVFALGGHILSLRQLYLKKPAAENVDRVEGGIRVGQLI